MKPIRKNPKAHYKNNKQSKRNLILLVTALVAGAPSTNAQTVVNGDFSNNFSGWTTSFSPDITTTGTNWAGGSGSSTPSNNGGKWATGYNGEAWRQNVSGFIVGQEYKLIYETADLYGTTVASSASTPMQVTIGGINLNAPYANNSGTWEYVERTFIATNETMLLQFTGGTGSGNPTFSSYISVDDISISPVAPVPEPSSSALLALGALTLISRRRR